MESSQPAPIPTHSMQVPTRQLHHTCTNYKSGVVSGDFVLGEFDGGGELTGWHSLAFHDFSTTSYVRWLISANN